MHSIHFICYYHYIHNLYAYSFRETLGIFYASQIVKNIKRITSKSRLASYKRHVTKSSTFSHASDRVFWNLTADLIPSNTSLTLSWLLQHSTTCLIVEQSETTHTNINRYSMSASRWRCFALHAALGGLQHWRQNPLVQLQLLAQVVHHLPPEDAQATLSGLLAIYLTIDGHRNEAALW